MGRIWTRPRSASQASLLQHRVPQSADALRFSFGDLKLKPEYSKDCAFAYSFGTAEPEGLRRFHPIRSTEIYSLPTLTRHSFYTTWAGYVDVGDLTNYTGDEFTFVFVAQVSTGNTNGYYFDLNSPQRTILVQRHDNVQDFAVYRSGHGWGSFGDSTRFADGLLHAVVFTFQGPLVKAFVDGQYLGSVSHAAISLGATPILFARYNVSNNYFNNRQCEFAGCFSHYAPDETARELSRNPYGTIFDSANDAAFLFSVADAGNIVNVPSGAATYPGQVPSVVSTDKHIVNAPLGTMALTGQVPEAVATETAANTTNVPLGTMAIVGQVPQTVATGHRISNLPLGASAYTALVPTAVVDQRNMIEAPAGAITFTGLAPSLVVTTKHIVNMPVGALAIVGSDLQVISGDTLSLTQADLDAIAHAVWIQDRSSYTNTDTFGGWVNKKLLTVSKFLGLQ